MKKRRLDEYLIANGYVKNKPEAFIKVTEGAVFINGQKAISPAQMILPQDIIKVREGKKYVGRGALKLEGAVKIFQPSISGKIGLDIGSATGGFTEILLQNGAVKVYAVDTAVGKLALKLREDPRVVVMENTDIRKIEKLPEEPEIVSIDVSLISLRNILPSVKRLAPHAETIALFKPQYETREMSILKHGVIKNDTDREKLLADFENWLKENSWTLMNKCESPIRGDKGNTEYLFYIKS